MYTPLSKDYSNLDSLLEQVRALTLNHLSQQATLPPSRWVDDLTPMPLPEHGLGAAATLTHFTQEYAGQFANSAGPRYFGFVTGGTTPAALMGDWLVSTYDQNAFGTRDSIAPQLEKQTIHFLKQLFGIPDTFYGSFLTGATMSNFVSLATARQWIGSQHGQDVSQHGLNGAFPIKVFSGTPHASVYKSLSMLGLGRSCLKLIPTLPDREAMDVAALEEQLKTIQHPVIVVANAGTVNIVDFDDLEALARLKERYPFWLHVDGAFGGFAGCSPLFSHYLQGLSQADSITIDAHKWLNVPYDAAMQFTRHRALQGQVFQNQATYLGQGVGSDFLHYTPENSRRFRALPAWFTLMAYGRAGYAEIVERNCALAHAFGERIKASSHYRLLAAVRMNVVCFTLGQTPLTVEDIQRFLDLVRDDGRVFFSATVYKGIPAIRVAVSNWQTENHDMDTAWDALEAVYTQQWLPLQEVKHTS